MAEDLDRIHNIAWIDLLGFVELLERQPLKDVVTFLRDHLPHAVAQMTSEVSFANGGFEVAGRRCEVEQFQDTLVLWTWESDVDALDRLIKTVEILVAVLHSNGYPSRGGISQGTLYTSRLDRRLKEPRPSIVVGGGVIAAARLEKECPGATTKIDPHGGPQHSHQWREMVQELQEQAGSSGRLHEYPIKTAKGNHLLVGWPFPLKDQKPSTILGKMWPHGRPHHPRAAEIYAETESYLQWWMDPRHFGIDHDRIERATRSLKGQ